MSARDASKSIRPSHACGRRRALPGVAGAAAARAPAVDVGTVRRRGRRAARARADGLPGRGDARAARGPASSKLDWEEHGPDSVAWRLGRPEDPVLIRRDGRRLIEPYLQCYTTHTRSVRERRVVAPARGGVAEHVPGTCLCASSPPSCPPSSYQDGARARAPGASGAPPQRQSWRSAEDRRSVFGDEGTGRGEGSGSGGGGSAGRAGAGPRT